MAENNNGATLGFEEKLWQAADKMRNNMDAAEYKHVVLGLLFLKYISDAFEEKYEELKKDALSDPEDRDEYMADNIFWVAKEARWTFIKENAKSPKIGQIIDEAMVAIEKDNANLKGVLPKDYARSTLDKTRLGELIDILSFNIGDKESRSQDILGRVYEYFLSKFASAEGKNGGEFYTPQCIVKLLVEMIEPMKGRIYDPCCGSGGMFVQAEKFIYDHKGDPQDIKVYGQENNERTWRMAKMNLAIHGILGNLGSTWGDTFARDLHPDLKADVILANPPFNIKDWARREDDARWAYGVPPAGNANYAWLQHILSKLTPDGQAGVVMANGSMSSNSGGEGQIRAEMVEADVVSCMVALPTQLFRSTGIPVCVWFLARNKGISGEATADRRGQTLFIDARNLGHMVDRAERALSDDDIAQIAGTFAAWRGIEGEYEDVPGFCRSVPTAEIKAAGYALTPGRYVGTAPIEADGEPLDEKIERLTKELFEAMDESARLDAVVREQLGRLS